MPEVEHDDDDGQNDDLLDDDENDDDDDDDCHYHFYLNDGVASPAWPKNKSKSKFAGLNFGDGKLV